MAAGRLLLPGWMPAVDGNGDPIPNAKVYFYYNKTTTLAPVFADEALSLQIANPVEANATGRFPAVWADGEILYSAAVEAPYGPAGVPFSYDNLSASLAAEIVLTEAAEAAAGDAEIAYQNILDAIQAAQDADGDAAVAGAIAGQAAGTAAANVVVADLLSDGGSDMVGFEHAGSSFYGTLARALNQYSTVRDFGAIGDDVPRQLSEVSVFGNTITSGWSLAQWQDIFPHATSLSDQLDWAAIQAAINWRQNTSGGEVLFQQGRYRTNRAVNITTSGIRLAGFSAHTAISSVGGSYDSIHFYNPAGDNNLMNGCGISHLCIEEGAKTGGLAINGENLERFEMLDLDINQGFMHFRNFNNCLAAHVRSWFPNRAGIQLLLSGGEGGLSTNHSDVFTLRDCSFSGNNSSGSAPANNDRHGVVIDGFVTTVLMDKVYAIGVEGCPVWTRNTVGASLGPRHIHLRGVETEWSSVSALNIDGGAAWVRVTECDFAGAWATKGVVVNTGVRHVLIANNDIRDSGEEGIVVNGTHVQIQGNRIYANSRPSRGGTAGASDGIYLYGDSRIIQIQDNIFGDDGVPNYQRYGVGVGANADQHIVSGNIGIYNEDGVLSSPYPNSATRFYQNNMGNEDIGT